MVDFQRLIISQTIEQWLRSIGSLGQSGAKNEDVLIKEWHLHIGMGAVKLDGAGSVPLATGTPTRVAKYVATSWRKFVKQHKKFAVGRGECEALLVEVYHCSAGSAELSHRVIECVDDRLWCRVGLDRIRLCLLESCQVSRL